MILLLDNAFDQGSGGIKAPLVFPLYLLRNTPSLCLEGARLSQDSPGCVVLPFICFYS